MMLKPEELPQKPETEPVPKPEANPKPEPEKKKEEKNVPTKDPFKFGSVISMFQKAAELKNKNSAFCPHFMELKFANGCHYDCQWCYLMGTFGRWRKDKDFTDPRRPVLMNGSYVPKVKPDKEITQHLRAALESIETPTLFNSGELSDSMASPSTLLNVIIPIFEEYRDKGHKLLILTKSNDITLYRKAVKHHAPEFTVVSHSINAEWVSNAWEKGAPNPLERLTASRAAADIGYETRLRLDPMVPVRNWQVGYRRIIEEIMRINSRARVITLGSLRGLQSTINIGRKLGKDMSWTEYLTDNSSWGKKIPAATRIELYSFAMNELKRHSYTGDVTLCKETLEIWDALRKTGTIDYYPGERLCNCVLEAPGKPDYYKKREFKKLEI